MSLTHALADLLPPTPVYWDECYNPQVIHLSQECPDLALGPTLGDNLQSATLAQAYLRQEGTMLCHSPECEKAWDSVSGRNLFVYFTNMRAVCKLLDREGDLTLTGAQELYRELGSLAGANLPAVTPWGAHLFELLRQGQAALEGLQDKCMTSTGRAALFEEGFGVLPDSDAPEHVMFYASFVAYYPHDLLQATALRVLARKPLHDRSLAKVAVQGTLAELETLGALWDTMPCQPDRGGIFLLPEEDRGALVELAHALWEPAGTTDLQSVHAALDAARRVLGANT